MLSTVGSVSSQGGGVVLWNYGVNPFSLPFSGSGSVIVDYYRAQVNDASFRYYGINASSLNLQKSKLKIITTLESGNGGDCLIRVTYTDATITDFTITASTPPQTEVELTINPLKILNLIQSVNQPNGDSNNGTRIYKVTAL